jgi:multisubunit Na+/H+ antiporter MnhB subunit
MTAVPRENEPTSRTGRRGARTPDVPQVGLMIATSTVVMFVLTYTNAFPIDHIRWSEERLYMALLMGAAMALVMLAFMRSMMMYRNRTLNLVIVALALALGGTSLYLSRLRGWWTTRRTCEG